MHLHVIAVNWKQSRLHGKNPLFFSPTLWLGFMDFFTPKKGISFEGSKLKIYVHGWPHDWWNMQNFSQNHPRVERYRFCSKLAPPFYFKSDFNEQDIILASCVLGDALNFLRYPPLYFNEQNPIGNRTFGSFESIDMVSRSKPKKQKRPMGSESWPNQSAILTS